MTLRHTTDPGENDRHFNLTVAIQHLWHLVLAVLRESITLLWINDLIEVASRRAIRRSRELLRFRPATSTPQRGPRSAGNIGDNGHGSRLEFTNR
jgi:hypothetical protein